MTAILTILKQFDALKLQQQPYAQHYAHGLGESNRLYYGALFFMALFQQGAITTDQQRMLDLWLPSLGLDGRQVELCEMAVSLEKDGLADALEDFQTDARLRHALLLDIMVFSRVAGPLNDNCIRLLEALAGFFALTESTVADIVYISASVLGLDVQNIDSPDPALDLTPYSVYEEFLYDYRPNREKRLFAWVTEKGITDKIPCYCNRLNDVTWLLLEPRYFPLPAEIDLLTNLKSVIIDLSGLYSRIESGNGWGLKHIKNVTALSVSFNSSYYSAEILDTLPDEICEFSKLKTLRIGCIVYDHSGEVYDVIPDRNNFKYINDKVKDFIKKNKVELVIPEQNMLALFK